MSARPIVQLVDDDDDLRESLADLLRDAGFDVREYGDAKHALADLKSGFRPDAILLDLMMPEMNGWQFRSEQCADPGFADVPVVVITAGRQPLGDALFAGCESLPKPFPFRELLATLDRLLEAPRA